MSYEPYESWRISFQDSEQAARAAFIAKFKEAESLRTQLEEQKALVARCVDAIEFFCGHMIDPGESCNGWRMAEGWWEYDYDALLASVPSAQQDAAILRAAREHEAAWWNKFLNTGHVSEESKYHDHIEGCAICKAVRGEKDAPTG